MVVPRVLPFVTVSLHISVAVCLIEPLSVSALIW